MRSFIFFVLLPFFAICLSTKVYSQENKKTFLGSYWSTKPDTSIKRESVYGLIYGCELKFFNFNTLYNNPWNFNLPKNAPVPELNIEYILGKPAKIYLSQFIMCGFPDNNLNPSQGNIYSMEMSGYVSYGLSAGHCFFGNWKHKFLKTYLSSGLVYNASLWKQNGELAENQYTFGDLMARFQLMLEYPKGLYQTSKKFHSSMGYVTFEVKIGYDAPLQQMQQLHLFDLKRYPTANLPSFNMGGYFLGVSINWWTYRNKELWKQEMSPKKN